MYRQLLAVQRPNGEMNQKTDKSEGGESKRDDKVEPQGPDGDGEEDFASEY